MNMFVINGSAGNGNALRVWKRLEPKLEHPYAVCLSTSGEEAFEQVNHHLQLYPKCTIIVIGGDGTIHRMLSLLAGSEAALGIIPAGSGNDTARGFGIPKRPEKALKVIQDAHIRSIDLLYAYDTWTLTALATGFDAEVAHAADTSWYKSWCNRLGLGSVAYLLGIIHTLIRYKPVDAVIEVDGQSTQYKQVWLCAVANTSTYGGGIRICPDAASNDGQFDLCIVHHASRLKLMLLLPTVLFGRHTRLRYVTIKRGRKARIEPSVPQLTIGDGEEAGNTPFVAELFPSKLRLLVPADR
ncbi:lipid kinase, YegS/Rv2252/BmrU family [Paenibacillus aquistagni]|uniref:Lipid kinase, YegS/Rv2252/BmrU family n=2 Tax=Paenibacillus aquistagni TaxID=1852522 RepID=A0A1X7LAY4_9BACL|nr:lipid kinase, YegS/Rv2252/BmrU family [Paenibacillus aquistagni]